MGQSFSDLAGTVYETASLMPPANVTSNFDNPPNNNTAAWVGYIFIIFVATTSFLLRAYSRYLAMSLRMEDVLLFLGFVSLCDQSRSAPLTLRLAATQVLTANSSHQGNFIGAIYAGMEMIYHPGYFVHQWNVILREAFKFSYVRRLEQK